ncbi:hypothetical protein LRP50_25280 [Enterovibrio sp. ZSDZ42]|uniref:Uncharacterized protein n=1 Tax=Enterovibrio gelatinilyticus TaxID=2899819 RepID=A0ABT5R832_9GAMM|nr:hypothetical protein [Enterovibrio sp. ZSDZ42]MDD1796433.1 hypothetical protein [Enterovibrio sp. ZSDZ42]
MAKDSGNEPDSKVHLSQRFAHSDQQKEAMQKNSRKALERIGNYPTTNSSYQLLARTIGIKNEQV